MIYLQLGAGNLSTSTGRILHPLVIGGHWVALSYYSYIDSN